MNWLAHLYLSDPNPASRIGNLLPDILPPASLAALPPIFQHGIAQHRRIDAFTDAHPIVRRSIQRIDPPFRRFGGILCDIFYDHFLARDWPLYSSEPLKEFADAIYASFDDYRASLPPDIYHRLNLMKASDLLCSYYDVSGVACALDRIDSRLRWPVSLARAISLLEHNYDAFHSDFQAFFPELRSHVSNPDRALP